MTKLHKLFQLFAALVLLAGLLAPVSSAALAKQSDEAPRAHPALLQMAQEYPNEKLRVIVQRKALENLPAQALERMGGKKTKDLPLINGFALELPGKAVEALARSQGVRWISLDAPLISTGILTSVDNIQIEYTYPASESLQEIGVDRLQSELALDGQGISVAVVDSGIVDHKDLIGPNNTSRILAASNHTNAAGTGDGYGHGSHIAGILAGNGNASNGKYKGMAPGVNLINVKVSDDEGYGTVSDLVEGLQWIYENKAAYNIRAVNISVNSSVPEPYHTSALDAAVEILWFNGIVVVVSAGNNGTGSGPVTLLPPANDPFVITVGSADDLGTVDLNDDLVSAFSAYGLTEDKYAKPDLVAPGRNVISLSAGPESKVNKNHPKHRVDDNYFRMSGTSMAAPMVTGAVALLLQDEPNLTPDQVKYRLMATAIASWPAYDPAKAGAGYLDAYAAVQGTTTESANIGITASQTLWTGSDPAAWDSVAWNSVAWNSVAWNSVAWNSVAWNSVAWNSVAWNSSLWDD